MSRVPVVLFLTHLSVCQATAEQIRLAQMIYDKNDADFEDKVKQVMFVHTHTLTNQLSAYCSGILGHWDAYCIMCRSNLTVCFSVLHVHS